MIDLSRGSVNNNDDHPVVILKLVGGEQVIGRMGDVTLECVTLHDPRTLAVVNQSQLAFAPFMFATDKQVTIRTGVLAVGFDIPANIADSYVQAVTGIQLARGLPR